MPDISIIMPVFNAALYLEECLDSIIAQKEQDWELIAVDDFSTDETKMILDTYRQKDDRIQVLSNTKKGIIPALQLAFPHSSGGFITRMDADDTMPPHRLERMKTQLLSHGKGHLATGLVHYFSANKLGAGYQRYQQWLNELTEKGDNFSQIYKECVIPSPCWMVSREDFIRCGAFDSEIYPEDYDLAFRFYQAELKVIPEEEVLLHWRDYPIRSSRTDPNYADHTFLELKVHYFLALDRDKTKGLVLWGAGKKGKKIAELLHQKEVPFRWICNQKRKWGHRLHGVVFESTEELNSVNNPQVIVAVANPEAQVAIREELERLNIDYFFFC